MKKALSILMSAAVLTVMMLCGSLTVFAGEPPEGFGTVSVTGGEISGVAADTEGVTIFKGIPYAAPPVDDLRWKAPEAVIPWDGVLACDTFSAICPQSTTAYGFYQKEFYADPYPKMSEDCLYLNVWTPADSASETLPVMVYIHGGGYGAGWGHEIEFDGEGFAEKGVILVTINYRLNVFGFLSHDLLADETGNSVSGNYGLLDQVAALTWVKENISAFGGDASNVTVFGQSAGAMGLSNLVCSPLAEGLIDKVIFQSGGMLGSAGGVDSSKTSAYTTGQSVLDYFGVSSIDELRNIPSDELYTGISDGGFSFSPHTDGYLITDTVGNHLAAGTYLDIPYMIGSNEDEFGGMFAGGTTSLGNSQLALGRTPAYAYLFTRDLPGDDLGSFHSGEIWYIFETMDRCWRPFTSADYELAGRLATYWTNFAKSGNPNGEGLPAWSAYTANDKNIQILDIDESIADLVLSTDRRFVGKGEYYNLTVALEPASSSNAATLTISYDADKFAYHEFVAADGITTISIDNDAIKGELAIMLGNLEGYNLADIGSILFQAREDATLLNEKVPFSGSIDYVVLSGGEKVICSSWKAGRIGTRGLLGDTNNDGVVDLIDLSNMIDWFGLTEDGSGWEQAEYFDFNENGRIDISDVAKVASLIK